MKAVSFILMLLICSYVVIFSTVSLMQSVEAPKVSQDIFDSNSVENVILTDSPVEPQDPGSGGGGEGVI